MVYVTDRDRIIHVDALQRHMDEVDAKADAKANGSDKADKPETGDAETEGSSE